jgi:hypothetical protein
MADRRRRYCSASCFDEARKRRDRQRKWGRAPAKRLEASRRWKRSDRGQALTAERNARAGVKARRALLFNAHAEARQRGVNVRDVLGEWGAPLGRAGLMALLEGEAPKPLSRCRRCGKRRPAARHRYCSAACFRAARLAYFRRRYKAKRRASRQPSRSACRRPDSRPARRRSSWPCL